MAKIFVDALHPIANTPIEKAFPYTLFWVGWLKKCFSCCSKEEKGPLE